MAAITEWYENGRRFYEYGCDCAILYKYNPETGCYDSSHVWPGLISVTESSEGGAEVAFSADGNKYFTTREYGSFKAELEALTHPDGVKGFDGLDAYAYTGSGIWVDGQPNSGGDSTQKFALAYRTTIGCNQDAEWAYRWHVIYNASFSRPERRYRTYGEDLEVMTYTWSMVTANVDFRRHHDLYPTSHITFDTRRVSGWGLLLDLLLGVSNEMIGTLSEPIVPNPDLALEFLEMDRTHMDEIEDYLSGPHDPIPGVDDQEEGSGEETGGESGTEPENEP